MEQELQDKLNCIGVSYPSIYESKIDLMIDVLVSGMDPHQVWKTVFNKMTSKAKRQVLGELLNTIVGTGDSATCDMFRRDK